MTDKFHGKYRVESTRLNNWDYGTNGNYFITICVKNRDLFFGNVHDGKMVLSETGKIAAVFWQEIPVHFPFVKLDEFIIMPNHVHGIIKIEKTDGGDDAGNVKTRQCVETRHCLVSTNQNANSRFQNQGQFTLSSIIGAYKSICTKTINKMQNNIFFQWQPRFYDHIIRNEKSLYNIRNYIRNNPLNWDKDDENPERKPDIPDIV